MFHRTLSILVAITTLTTGSALAQTPTTIPPYLAHQWQRIANLPPGTPILVREHYAPYPIPCTLVWIDNNSVACDGPDDRVIYPAASLASIAPDTPPRHIRVGILVATGAGAFLGGLAGSNGTAGTTAAGVLIGGALGASIAAIATPEVGPYRSAPAGIRIPLRAPHRHAIFP